MGVFLFKKLLLFSIIIALTLLTVTGVSAQDNETVIMSENNEPILSISSEVNADPHSFTGLQKQIENANSKSTLYLSGTYKYNKNTDSSLKDGVVVDKDLKIVGKNKCTIDGSGLARCLNIKKGSTVTLENIKIKNGFSTSGGGGIKIGSHCKVTIKKCEFSNNVAYNSNGGAILSGDSCTIKIYSSVFKKNKATHLNKANGNLKKRGMGAAIKTNINTNLYIYDSSFKQNTAYLSIILVVSKSDSVRQTSYLYINNCLFTYNKAKQCGVIYLDEYGKCTIMNSVFSSNTSPDNAGILVLDSSLSATIKNCVFYKNRGYKGGAISIKIFAKKDLAKVKIIKCRFTKNYASVYGGAIYSVSGALTVRNCKFTSNRASIFGGAIYARLGTLKLSSSKFSKNKANYAGALCLACKKSTTKYCSITKNKAYYLYGAYYSIKHNKLSKCHVKSNKIYNYTKIYLYKSGKYIKVKVTDNKDKTIKKQVRLIFKGSKKIKTKYYKSSDKKYKKIKIPKSVKGTYKVTMKVKKAKYFSKSIIIRV